jgi:hypothetical protein
MPCSGSAPPRSSGSSASAPGFALFSYLERKAGEAGVKGNLRSINPRKGMPSGAYEESAVEVRLETLTM